MRPFFGYNFGDYLAHWLSLNKKKGVQMPNIFMVSLHLFNGTLTANIMSFKKFSVGLTKYGTNDPMTPVEKVKQ